MDKLRLLQQQWRAELAATRAAQLAQRSKRPWLERLAAGHALTTLTFSRHEQRRTHTTDVLIWFAREDRKPLPAHRIRSGYPAILWPVGAADRNPQPAPEQQQQRGKIVRITSHQLCLRFPRDYDRFIERSALNLEREDSEVTFQRGDDALRSLMQTPAASRKRALLFGDAIPSFAEAEVLTFRDEQLNAGQRRAVEDALRARDALLIHGPPGTGKTRTLVEVVRQNLLLGRRILVTAASNVAVDNLARRLAALGIKVLRLGAAHKVSPDLAELTLQYKMAQLPEMAEAQKHFDAAQRIADSKGRRVADPRKRISELRRQAHQSRDLARARVMRRSRVVCATAGGVDAVPLGDDKFDLVVLDEATQATDPVALAAIVRGAIVVLAGDPQQLPPTVIAQDDATRSGLTSTLFERCAARWPDHATARLTTQYRMSEELMRFPSMAHYGGSLQAAEDNRQHRLVDIIADGVMLNQRDARPWILIDTSGFPHGAAHEGKREAFDEETASYFNESHGELTIVEIERLLAQGIEARDIAAICPYAAQTRRLRQQLSGLLERGLEIGTVDGFQGREKEVVVVDLLRSNPDGQLGFLQDIRRTNVAITRAKRQLIIIANGATISSHPYYQQLLVAAKEAGAWEPA